MILDELRADGLTKLSWALRRDQVDLIHRHLAECPVFNAHMAAQATLPPRPLKEVMAAREWPMFSHAMHDVLRAPVVLPLAIELTALAGAYFQEPALLFSLNAYWTQPATGQPYSSTHGWHRDGDDRKFLALMIYGTDVLTPEDGAHCWLPSTHTTEGNIVPATWKLTEQRVLGPAGTMFLTNGRNFHRGLRPAKPRLIMWARWCVSDPPAAYRWDKLEPMPASELAPGIYPNDEALRRSIRLVIR